MSDTPETDQCWDKYINFPYSNGAGDLRILAQRLERERDEARTTIEDAKRALNATDYEGILLAAMRVKEERDEARKDAAQLADRLSGFELRTTEELARLERERNEARAVSDELASVAAYCLGWHDHESPDAAIKIAAALKRWKKSK